MREPVKVRQLAPRRVVCACYPRSSFPPPPSFWPPLAPLALPFLGHTKNPSRIPLAIPRPRIHSIAPSPFRSSSTSPRLPLPFLPPNAAARWRTLAVVTPPSSGQPPAALPGLMRALCSFYRPSPAPLPPAVGLPRMLRLYSVPQRAIHPTCIPQHRRLTWPFAGPVPLLRPAPRSRPPFRPPNAAARWRTAAGDTSTLSPASPPPSLAFCGPCAPFTARTPPRSRPPFRPPHSAVPWRTGGGYPPALSGASQLFSCAFPRLVLHL
ncbi:hypothetical protein C8R44DRAFT_873709 [Mycena epipterygia]|nr:hypothetical protein C8R44DRAFT_873709 [Mycena epipterygia]